ncbi:hypothetical protein LPJ61_005990, partial [Coemansia biformis]
MAQAEHGVLARLVCVAINACPQIATELHSLVSETEAGDRQRVLGVLAAHGGERFGEKDNTDELAVLEPWLRGVLAQRAAAENMRPLDMPSIHGVLATVLGPRQHDGWTMALLELGPDTDCSSRGALRSCLERSWAASRPSLAMPPLVFVQGEVPVSVLCSTATIDFDRCTDADTSRRRRDARENARKEAAASTAVADGIGAQRWTCDEIAQSLDDVRSWLARPALRDRTGISDITPSCEAARHHLESLSVLWGTIIDRVRGRQQRALRALRDAERAGPYVLRAFVVSDAAGSRSQASVVRRFGKAETPGHLAVLGADGICRPARAQDVGGVAVESVWVCCSDDPECLADSAADAGPGGSQGGINTVVADPDDEIFCQVCGYLESWSYNQIILCDGCELGTHQMCHVPV